MARHRRTQVEAIQERWSVDVKSGCWIWDGKPDNNGYGQLNVARDDGSRRVVKAHQAVWEVLVGQVPGGLELDHTCRRPICVNPDHLDPVPHRTNILRGDSPAARAAKAIECPKGHPYDEINTYWRPDGAGRGCRTCSGWTGKRI